MSITDLEKLNSKIADLCGCHSPKHRIVIYALDKNYLSDSEFQRIKNAKFLENQLLQLPWVMALFWARLFYEEGDGNNYRKIMQEGLGIMRPEELFERIHSTCGWFPKDEILTKAGYRFQAECWLTGNEGDTSNLWKALPRFVRKALPGKSDEEICQLDGIDEDDTTPPILWLLNKRDADFCRVLKWLNVGSSQEPLGNIFAKNPINEKSRNRDDFNASLGVLIAAKGPRIAIKVSGIWFGNSNQSRTRDISVTQFNKSLFKSSISKSTVTLHLDDEMLGSSLNAQESFEISLGNNKQLSGSDFKALPWKQPGLLLFKNFGGTFCKFVEHGSHTQGRIFYLAGRATESKSPQLLLGNLHLPHAECLGEIRHSGVTRCFFKYDLGDLREDVSALVEEGNSTPLAYIGRKPFLSICGGSASDCQISGEENITVFEGVKEIQVQSSNFIDGKMSWEIHDPESSNEGLPEVLNHSEDSHCITLRVGDKSYGKKWSLVATSQGGCERASMTLVFLPPLEDKGVKWIPAQDGEGARFRDAFNTGREFGTISFPGGSIQVNRPLNVPQWGWRQGWGGVLCEYNREKQFPNHKDCDSWQLVIAMPASGNWSLKFNDEILENQRTIIIQHLLGARIGPQHIQGENLGADDLLQFVNQDRSLENHKAASIHRLPAHPVVGLIDGVPKIYIPKDFKNNHCRLFLVRESSLLDAKIEELNLDKIHASGIHQIEDLPKLKDQEGAWLILAETSHFSGLQLESVIVWGSMLRNFDIYGICAIANEGESQTFLELLKIWLGKGEELTEKMRSEIRSRLDILDKVFLQVNAEHGVDKILIRARSRREVLGYGSHLELQNYFDSQYCKMLNDNNETITHLLNLLLECGFNWLAEFGWIESLHERARKLLPQGSRFTPRMKNLIKQACPLLETFELTHAGKCSDIPNIDQSFFTHPHNQPEIGLMVASPNSAVPAYRTGFFFRGVVPDGMKLAKLLKILEEHPRALIKGVAGSGKTMLAMDKAASFAKAGHRTLFLCYNELLAEFLRDQVPEALRGKLNVRHFHAWCRECCVKPAAVKNGICFQVPEKRIDRKKFWDTTSAELLLKAIPLINENYDALVIDEGQDFANDWWYPIEAALDHSRADRSLYIFYDPDQNLYGRGLQFPIEAKPYALLENCRNTQSISRFCRAIIGNDQRLMGSAPEGELPVLLLAHSVQDQFSSIQQILDQLLKSEGLQSSQIAILVAGGITDSCGFKGINKCGKHQLSSTIQDWKNKKGVLLASSKKFKGLEADVVILTDMPEPGSKGFFSESDLYVSASRGKHRLYLICNCSDAQKYGVEKLKISKTDTN